jgi:hypothetical protein
MTLGLCVTILGCLPFVGSMNYEIWRDLLTRLFFAYLRCHHFFRVAFNPTSGPRLVRSRPSPSPPLLSFFTQFNSFLDSDLHFVRSYHWQSLPPTMSDEANVSIEAAELLAQEAQVLLLLFISKLVCDFYLFIWFFYSVFLYWRLLRFMRSSSLHSRPL